MNGFHYRQFVIGLSLLLSLCSLSQGYSAFSGYALSYHQPQLAQTVWVLSVDPSIVWEEVVVASTFNQPSSSFLLDLFPDSGWLFQQYHQTQLVLEDLGTCTMRYSDIRPRIQRKHVAFRASFEKPHPLI